MRLCLVIQPNGLVANKNYYKAIENCPYYVCIHKNRFDASAYSHATSLDFDTLADKSATASWLSNCILQVTVNYFTNAYALQLLATKTSIVSCFKTDLIFGELQDQREHNFGTLADLHDDFFKDLPQLSSSVIIIRVLLDVHWRLVYVDLIKSVFYYLDPIKYSRGSAVRFHNIFVKFIERYNRINSTNIDVSNLHVPEKVNYSRLINRFLELWHICHSFYEIYNQDHFTNH